MGRSKSSGFGVEKRRFAAATACFSPKQKHATSSTMKPDRDFTPDLRCFNEPIERRFQPSDSRRRLTSTFSHLYADLNYLPPEAETEDSSTMQGPSCTGFAVASRNAYRMAMRLDQPNIVSWPTSLQPLSSATERFPPLRL